MTTYTFRAATPQGRTVGGTEAAASVAEVERRLAGRGLLPLDVSPADGGRSRERDRWRGRRADAIEATRYLATLLDAGFPLDRALGTVARIAARADVAEAVLGVRARVRAGAPLADALAEHPRIFPRIAVGMVRAGERGGTLADALDRLAAQLEREQALRARLTSALLYPAIMLVVGAGAVLVLLLVVLPRLVAMLDESGAAIPASTAALLAVTAFGRRWWPALAALAGLAAAGAATYRRTPGGRLTIDTVLLRLPVVGALRRQLAAARLGRSLATLLGSGLPALAAMEIAAGGLGDAAAAAAVMRAREEVRAGERMAPALERGRAFPHLFLQMVEVGEEGGRLPEMLGRGAAAMEREAERGLDRLVRLVEPAMILVLGGAVGFFALALLQAVYGIRADAL